MLSFLESRKVKKIKSDRLFEFVGVLASQKYVRNMCFNMPHLPYSMRVAFRKAQEFDDFVLHNTLRGTAILERTEQINLQI